ncbi:hypothetical protein [Streptomyces sp. NPDC060002]|uniref:hypothetical protein n=1 Tax=Streptomyces sp. NPDC060002 TaxID=3347033 RepID=UPI0036C05B32
MTYNEQRRGPTGPCAIGLSGLCRRPRFLFLRDGGVVVWFLALLFEGKASTEVTGENENA